MCANETQLLWFTNNTKRIVKRGHALQIKIYPEFFFIFMNSNGRINKYARECMLCKFGFNYIIGIVYYPICVCK